MASDSKNGKWANGARFILKRLKVFLIPEGKNIPSELKTSTTALFPVDTLRGSIVLFSHPLNMMDLSQIIVYISGEAVPVKQINYGNDSKIDGQLDIPLDSASKAVLKKAVCVN